MLGLSNPSWASGLSGRWLGILLDASFKGLAVVLAAGALSLALRRASASARHLLWLLAIVALICLPILSGVLPQWRVPILPAWEFASAPEGEPSPEVYVGPPPFGAQVEPQPAPPAIHTDDGPVAALPASPEPAGAAAPPAAVAPPVTSESTASSSAAARAPARLHWSAWVLLAWAAGVFVVLAHLLIGTVGVWRTVRRATPIAGRSWALLARRLSEELHLSRPVKLLQSHGTLMPATWGLWRPVVLLPACADDWPAERRRIVLLHELVHVKRWDCLTQLLAQLACAVYWFNPACWLAARLLRIERERACDDLILTSGSKPSEYAGHLLEIVRSLRVSAPRPLAAVAMARRSRLESRLRAILDAKRNRRRLTRLALVGALAAVICIVVPLAALRPAEKTGSAQAATPDAKGTTHPPGDETKSEKLPAVVVATLAAGSLPGGIAAEAGTFAPDGKLALAIGSWQVFVYDTTTDKLLHRLVTNQQSPWSAAISGDGRFLATGRRRGGVDVYRLATGKKVNQLKAEDVLTHGRAVAFSPDGTRLFTWTDGPVYVWDLTRGKLLRKLKDHGGGSVAFAPNGKSYAVGRPHFPQTRSGEKVRSDRVFHRIEFWSLETGRKLRTFEPVEGGARALAFTPDGRYLAVSDSWWGFTFYDVAKGKPLAKPAPDGRRWWGRPAGFHRSRWVIQNDAKGEAIRLIDLNTGRVVPVAIKPEGKARLLAISPDGRSGLFERHGTTELAWGRLEWLAGDRRIAGGQENRPETGESAPAARPAETARQTLEAFFSAALAGRDREAIRLTDPASAVPQQVMEFRKIAGVESIKVATVHADAAAALARTTQLEADHGRKGVLLVRLIKSRGLWVISDIDLQSPVEAKAVYERFLKDHPQAVEIPPTPTPRPATQPGP